MWCRGECSQESITNGFPRASVEVWMENQVSETQVPYCFAAEDVPCFVMKLVIDSEDLGVTLLEAVNAAVRIVLDTAIRRRESTEGGVKIVTVNDASYFNGQRKEAFDRTEVFTLKVDNINF